MESGYLSNDSARRMLTALLAAWISVIPGPGRGQDAETLTQFTGAHTRVVWLQDHAKTANDVLGVGKHLQLMKFDSNDGQGETPLLGELRNYAKPLMTPDGQRVVYSDQVTQKFLVVNWDGTGKKNLGDGFALDVCRDPQDGTDWVYFAKRIGKPDVATYRSVRRVKLDDPKILQKVWEQTDISCDNFQLSADGLRAGGDFPWPHGGVADIKSKSWKKLDQGCWPSIAPDNSGLNWVLDGPHRHLQFHRPDQAEGWKVDISTAENVKGAEVFHPRWSNHVRFLALTGPYQIQGPINLISGGGPNVEVYVGRFNADYHSIEAWHQLTHNNRADFYPDVWVEGGEASVINLPGLKQSVPEKLAEWPGVTKSLVFAWSNGASANQLGKGTEPAGHSCEMLPHGAAVFGRFFDLRLLGGEFTFQIDDPDYAPTVRTANGTGLTVQMLVSAEGQPASEAIICRLSTTGQIEFQMSQKGSQLNWTLGIDHGSIEIPAWKNSSVNRTVHLGVMISTDRLQICLDGQSVGTFPIRNKPASWNFNSGRLGSSEWRGHIEAVAIHTRSVTEDEMRLDARLARSRLLARKPIPRVHLQVKCLESSTIPKPDQILPYRRALALDVCEVLKSDAGAMATSGVTATESDPLVKSGDKILVARWVIMDGQPLPAANFKSGSVKSFTLERVTDHPELESERQMIDTTEIDLPVWYALNF
jgi:hypothetical protein